MSELLALDVAVLPPPDVTARAVALSAALPVDSSESDVLRLDHEHLAHVTLMQLFARANELDQVLARVDDAVHGVGPLMLRASGAGQATNTIWLAIDKAQPLVELHERLMEALRGLERPDGSTAAFFGDDARMRDVLWVAGYRLKSSFHHFEPHITLGHGSAPPAVAPFAFRADTVAICHLGRHCTCRRVLRQWTLTGADA
jgi:2'-5' RNA ligase